MGHPSVIASDARRLHMRGPRALIVMAFAGLCVILSGSLAPIAAQDASPAVEPSSAAGTSTLPEGFTRKMADAVDEVIAETVPVRQLPAAEGVTFRVVDAETFSEELKDLFRSEFPDDYVAAEDDLFTRLGLLDADDDLEQLILSLYESQVLAYYDPVTKTFSLIGPLTEIEAFEALIVSHEYGHAMQDARWDIDGTRIRDLSRSDEILAHNALAEGDATALMYDWAARELKLAQLLRISGEALTRQDDKVLARVPPILRRQLEFPYVDGLAFVMALRGRGDWAAVDEAWVARPQSTEQILHPDLYPDEAPVEVVLPDIAALLGPEWMTSYAQTMGEVQIGVWVADGRKPETLFLKLPGQLPRAEAAAGWGGDRLVSLDGPDGSWAVVWQTDWDTAADAAEFRKAARDAMKDLGGAHQVVDVDIAGGLSSPVLVMVADSKGTLDAVETALGLGS